MYYNSLLLLDSALLHNLYLLLFIIRPPQRHTLFPYTTLFRSSDSKIGEIGKQIDSIDSKPMLSALDNPYGEDTAVDRKSTRPELQSRFDLVCRLLLEKKKNKNKILMHDKKTPESTHFQIHIPK